MICLDIIHIIQIEASMSREKYGPFNSTHEGYAVLKEEVEELWDLVKKSNQDGDLSEEMIKELTQICAVSYRMANEIKSGHIKWI